MRKRSYQQGDCVDVPPHAKNIKKKVKKLTFSPRGAAVGMVLTAASCNAKTKQNYTY